MLLWPGLLLALALTTANTSSTQAQIACMCHLTYHTQTWSLSAHRQAQAQAQAQAKAQDTSIPDAADDTTPLIQHRLYLLPSAGDLYSAISSGLPISLDRREMRSLMRGCL